MKVKGKEKEHRTEESSSYILLTEMEVYRSHLHHYEKNISEMPGSLCHRLRLREYSAPSFIHLAISDMITGTILEVSVSH